MEDNEEDEGRVQLIHRSAGHTTHCAPGSGRGQEVHQGH